MKHTDISTVAELRAAYAAQIKQLLDWAQEYMTTEVDPCSFVNVHYLRNGGFVVGLIGWDTIEYDLVVNLANEPPGWIHTFEAITLWKVHLDLGQERSANDSLLKQGVEKAVDAFLGGASLNDLRLDKRNKNISRAVRWAPCMISQLPEHLRPYAQRVLDLFDNGNVALSLKPSEDASAEMIKEFHMNYASKECVFGDYGTDHLGRVNLGTMETGLQTWPELLDLIEKARTIADSGETGEANS